MTQNQLKGRTALVTGSVQGIGLAVARKLAEAGCRIAVHGLADQAACEKAVSELEAAGAPEARFFDGDLRDPDAIAKLMHAVEAWGPLDILVNNAGIQHTASFEDMPAATWDAIIAVNLSSAFHTMQKALPAMAARGFGRVVNIASVHGLVASINKGPYVAAKHGLVGLSKVAALEYATAGSKHSGGVTINCVCPGWTETELIQPQINARAQQFGGDRDKAVASLLSEKQPTQRTSDSSEIGEAVLWLCSPLAHNITGISLPVDGGWTAQ
ncbi:SDR family oxidoreductase [Roseibium denhamense]|uniref:3-hydroxybutyrate dehydrogenase n=2 Tax=Roseibium denhamense TaxID=76305 RepID=A0ABY1NB63_9HYPH|nr:SDR family oxidoreductase [Roseibium denhamense]SMP05292.1 3-hydroxybutyrate dehydrogenase [Roseibium denhamense]